MQSIRVLHVDDERDFLDLAAQFLEREDDRLDVVSETSASAGLDRLGNDAFDCVVSDYQMPGMDGLAFLAAVREVDPDLPFVLFTGRGSEEVASDAISGGATDYLQKTRGTEQYELLANRVRNAVEQSRSKRRAANLERIRTLVGDVNQALVRASSRSEIETRICEIISDADPYRFAWVGGVDPDTGRVVPRVSAGEGDDYLDEIAITVDEQPTGRGPGGTALRERRVAVSHDVRDDPEFEPWRAAARKYGFLAVAGVPITFEDEVYGLLAVYADRPNAFDDTEQDLLAELGDDIAHALHAVETRATLREERDRRLSLVENNPSPIAEFVFEDGHPVITGVNPAFVDVFDHAIDDVVGTPVGEVLVPDAERDEYDGIRQRVYRGERVEADVQRRTASGVRNFLLRVIPYEVNEHAGGGYAWFVDVTEREAPRRRLESLISNLPGIVYRCRNGPDWPMEYVRGDCEGLTGHPATALETGDVLWGEDILHPDDRDRVWETVQDALADGDSFEVTYRIVTRDGTTKWVWERGRGAYAASGDPTTLEGFITEITERKERERRLRRQNERLEEFANIVSHDLRNPLTVAEGYLELAEADCDSEHLASIDRAHERMRLLIEDLLTLAREGETTRDVEAVALADVVERCWRNVETGGATLVVETDRTIRADRSQLQHLLENLIRNSMEHGSTGSRTGSDDSVEHGSTGSRVTPEDGVAHDGADVTVTVGHLSDGFYVADDGPGIPPAEREQVFETGYSGAPDGTGFGLDIVGRVADAHDWDVTITDAVDGGARVEIRGVEFADG